MKYYTSGDVSHYLNISVRTLRYYDQIDLVPPARIEESGKRLYTSREILLLEKIVLLKSLAMTLEDIKKIINQITIEEILTLHKEKLENNILQLKESLKNTHTLSNTLKLEGNLNWGHLLPLVKENAKMAGKNEWGKHFSEKEQKTLKEAMPKMEHPSTRKWINIIKRTNFCLRRNLAPHSEEGQTLAEDCLLLSEDFFKGDQKLGEKFWKARKSERASKEMGLYPISSEILEFMDEAINYYEEHYPKLTNKKG
ncbi:MerR family transcriptional regulator [Halobacillus shinanisalinarum]|uniref:MerR family transcriptional regulator n=1 Tax=Halobacillus shinanisalinarum TaxID=2932258 RepID=A0ABY4GWA1_9BACI|nr:MerR family transcriptional regulator [Halobacillus shinanisalinarum]UOQ92319.1 MerR family transcriptional regulator [Halobacillus shinanisalinarum]